MFLLAAVGSLLVGMILFAIAFSQITERTSILNTTVDLECSFSQERLRSLGKSLSKRQQQRNDERDSSEFSVLRSFLYLHRFIAEQLGFNNYTITNSSNSPVLAVNSTAIDSKSGVPASFSFIPGYRLRHTFWCFST